MTTLNTYNQTAATIKILNVLQDLRMKNLAAIVDDNQVEYNGYSGVCYLYIEVLNICICADEFNNDAYIITYEEDAEVELSLKEYFSQVEV